MENPRLGRGRQHRRHHLRRRRLRVHPRRPRRVRRVKGIRITGWGIAVPDKVVTNADLAVRLDTSDEWIVERTGIRERHIGGTTSGLAIEAAQAALAKAGRTAAEIDHLVLATTTPDGIVPGTAPTRAARHRHQGRRLRPQRGLLGLRLRPGHRGRAHRGRLGPDTAGRLRDAVEASPTWTTARSPSSSATAPAPSWSSRSTGPGSLLSWNMNSDGSLRHLLKCEHGGTLFMDGKEVFRTCRARRGRVGRAGHGRRRPRAGRHRH